MSQRGFTLLELTLALAILALLLSLTFGGFFSQAKIEGAAREELALSQAARLTLEQLQRDLSQTLAPGWAGLKTAPLTGRLLDLERVQGRRLDLLTRVGPSEAPTEPVVAVTYRTALDETAGPGQMALFRAVAPLLGEAGGGEEVLCRGLVGFKITYVDHKGQAGEEWSETSRLPAALKVELDLAAGAGRSVHYELLTGPLAALNWRPEKKK